MARSEDISVEAIVAEAEGGPREVHFGDEDDGVTLVIPRKWKRFKFMRAINRGDVTTALEAVFGAEAVVPLDEIDVTEEQFTAALEKIAESLGGVEVGNS
jgi:hypothetical protein